MKPMIAASLALLLSVTQAQALSCLRSDVARTFAWASEADERYVVLLGAFGFTQPPPNQSEGFDANPEQLEATFEGQYLGADRFVSGPPLDVTLSFECLGPWCGSVTSGEDILAFVEQTSDGFILRVDPCFSTVLLADAVNVQTVESCMRGGPCVERHF